ncbi:8-amino-7-oxononanoate synthase [Flavobacterium sp. RHBU_3]|uniref:8-amino-7-oxononanoate synthase n=1 Tax=Flavobacterium sp. RHBU_3 TaxID=3391184 RepID=UPI003984788E
MPTHTLHFRLYSTVASLPDNWDTLAVSNIFLSKAYLSVLEQSAPENLTPHFIGLFKEDMLCGIALAQYINLSDVNTLGQRERGFCVKEYLFKKFSSKVLVLGNNMLTGQNAYLLDKGVDEVAALVQFEKALYALKKHYRKQCIYINLITVKDFNESEYPDFDAAGYTGYYKFCTQPNMVFNRRYDWENMDDYLAALGTKYRTQYNRARKKAAGIEKKQLNCDEIKRYGTIIQELYLTVAGNASFNTFHLPVDHFYTFKKLLGDNFRFYGYFLDGKMVGFNTLIKNGADMDTYFLGYDASIQKEKMLYLNMLYDMAAYSINKQFNHIIYGRSAMEIKSSVGAQAEPVYGLIKHTTPLINRSMEWLFNYFDPKVAWNERSPFKAEVPVSV